MEKLYTVSKNKTRSWLWLRSWTPYCQIQTLIEGSGKNHYTIQAWRKSNPLWLYSGSDKQIKGLYLIECLMNYGQRFVTVQETGSKTIPKKKKCKKAKWLSAEAWQIAVKRREAKSKEEKERYTHLNAEFQRIARRDKKAFLSSQCEEIEENNRMGKTRDLFKKIRDTKGTFHAKMGSIKDRNSMDLREQKILRRGGKNTQKKYTKKIFTTQIITMLWSLT